VSVALSLSVSADTLKGVGLALSICDISVSTTQKCACLIYRCADTGNMHALMANNWATVAVPTLSLSLSLSHTHTHTRAHTHNTYIYIYPCIYIYMYICI